MREPDALAPGGNELRDQAPLRRVRVLELVHQHMVISSLQAVPAPRELVHLPEKANRPRQPFGEVHRPLRLERRAVQTTRDPEQSVHRPHEGDVQVPLEIRHRVGDLRRGCRHRAHVSGIRRRVAAVSLQVALCQLRSRRAVIIQEVARHAFDDRARDLHAARLPALARRGGPESRGHRSEVGRNQVVGIAPRRPVRDERLEAAIERREDALQARDESGECVGRRRTDSFGQEPADGRPGGQPAVDQRLEASPDSPLAEHRHEQPDVLGRCHPARRAESPVDRRLHEARRCRLVRDVEPGVEIRLQGELAQQREAERVDRADGNVREPVAQRRPARLVLGGLARLRSQVADDPIAHFGGGLPRERDRQNVRGVDARSQQVDVARHEDLRFAGACRRLEHDVARRIDR